MITRVKGSTFSALDNFNYINLGDYTAQNTDCTAILQVLLSSSAPVLIPPGTFLISGLTLPANSTLFGLGDKSILKQKDGSSVVGINVGAGCRLENFKLDGNKANQIGTSNSIQLASVADVVLEKLTIINTRVDSVSMTGANTKIRLERLKITGSAGSGIRLLGGSNIVLNSCECSDSDALATGHGITAGIGTFNVDILNFVARNNVGRGLSITGDLTRNSYNISVMSPRCSGNTREGIFVSNAQDITIVGGVVSNNLIDGLALSADTQFVRVSGLVAKDNTGYGIREVIAGATPNNNGFIYSLSRGNGNNVITKLGAQSFVI